MSSEKFDGLAKLISPLFEEHQWEWDEYGVPDQTDIKVTLKQLNKHLEDYPSGTTIEIGRIQVKKEEDIYEVYVKMGDYT